MIKGSGGVAYLQRELGRRFFGPMGHFTFWVYLIVGIVGFAGFGFWYEALPLMLSRPGSSSAGVFTAMLTFFPALAGSSVLQLLFADGEKPLKAFSVIYSAILIALAVWLGFARPNAEWLAYAVATLGCLLAVLMWWLTSGEDPAFNDALDDRTTLGPDTSVTPKGDLNGFEV